MIEIVKCRRCGKDSDADCRDMGTYFCHCENNYAMNSLVIQNIANRLLERFYESRQTTANALHDNANQSSNQGRPDKATSRNLRG